jgi:hypothetical protein
MVFKIEEAVKQKAVLWILPGIPALPATSARASRLYSSGGPAVASRYCSFSSSVPYLAGGNSFPYFTVARDGQTLAPILSLDLLGFNASFGGSHLGVASLVEGAGSGPREWAGRQGNGEGGGRGIGDGTGNFSNFFQDSGHGRSVADGWTRGRGYWGFEPTGFNPNIQTSDPTPLAVTPDPFTLLLFGTGLFLNAFLARYRAGPLREGS